MAGSRAIQDILGYVALTKAVNAVKDGVPNPFPSWLFTVKAEDRVIGNSVKFHRTYGMREAARVIQYGAAPRHRELQQEELVEAKFLHFGEERIFDPLVLQVLRDYESYDNSNMAKRLVANNVQTMGTLFGNAAIVMVATTLAKGAIYVDTDGNLLPTSSGSKQTFSQQIASANIGTCLDLAGSGIFGATGQGSWASPTTNIPKQLRTLQQTAAATHGYKPMVALYGMNVVEYLSQNDFVLDYLARTSGGMQSAGIKDNTIPDGLFGFQWVPVWEASYTKRDGTKTTLWPADGITFIPGQSDAQAFWSMFEGSYQVPTNINLQNDAVAALNSLKQVHGAFGYGFVSMRPPQVATVMGDTRLPAVKLVDVLYLADVVA